MYAKVNVCCRRGKPLKEGSEKANQLVNVPLEISFSFSLMCCLSLLSHHLSTILDFLLRGAERRGAVAWIVGRLVCCFDGWLKCGSSYNERGQNYVNAGYKYTHTDMRIMYVYIQFVALTVGLKLALSSLVQTSRSLLTALSWRK